MGTRPGAVLVAARDINTLSHLDSVLGETDLEERELVVMTVRLIQGPDAGERDLYDDTVLTDYEPRLFTQVVEHKSETGDNAGSVNRARDATRLKKID